MNISNELHTVASCSRDEAQRTGCYRISAEHIVLAIIRLTNCAAHRILGTICTDIDGLKNSLDAAVTTGRNITFKDAESIVPMEEVQNCMSLSVVEAGKLSSTTAGSEHLLLSISRYSQDSCRSILSGFGISPDAITKAIRAKDTPDSGSGKSASKESNSAGTGADPIQTPEPQLGTTGEAESFLIHEMHRLAYDMATDGFKKSERS